MKNFTSEQILSLANLTSRGVPLAKAKKQVLASQSHTTSGGGPAKPKLSLVERKDKLAAQIKDLGGEAPEPSASIPVFEQALANAKKAQDGQDSQDGQDGQDGGDSGNPPAPEGDTGVEDLM